MLPATSSLETEHQGAIVPELQDAVSEAHTARMQGEGIINAWDDPAFAAACHVTGKRNFALGGVATDVCAAPAAISAVTHGYNVKLVGDACGSRTMLADAAVLDGLMSAGVPLMST